MWYFTSMTHSLEALKCTKEGMGGLGLVSPARSHNWALFSLLCVLRELNPNSASSPERHLRVELSGIGSPIPGKSLFA